jgi:cytochrome c oxidase subunit 2
VDPTTTGAAAPSCPSTGPARPRTRRWAIAAAILTPLLLAGCQVPSFGAYHGSTTQGQQTYKLWQGFFIAGLVVGVFVLFLIVYAAFRYKKRSDVFPKQTQYHTGVEVLYTVVPIIIVLILFVFTVVVENEVTAVSPTPGLRVQVTAFQWGWQFAYPDEHIAPVVGAANIIDGRAVRVPEMVVPVGETVQIHLLSKDVIHGFYVPEFNFSRYAQPGFTDQYFDFKVLHSGTFRGQCTQLCGLYHSVMLFNVKAVPPAQFAAWVSQRQSTGSTAGPAA